jgi:hypothetical protein
LAEVDSGCQPLRRSIARSSDMKNSPTIKDVLLADITEPLAGPRDPAKLLIYADWLCEQSRPDDEHLMRWLARTRKWPEHRTVYTFPDSGPRKVPTRFSWAWYPERDFTPLTKPPEHSLLPQLLFHALPQMHFFVGHRYYSNWRAALADLRQALSTLRELVRV